MRSWWKSYGTALLVLGSLDFVWLGFVAQDFYWREIGDLGASTVRLVPAALFYLMYPAGLVTLALFPKPPSLAVAIGRGAVMGAVSFALYDLTNMATLRHWGVTLAVVDVVYGTLASATAAGVAYRFVRRA